jgi:Zn-finger nucleic acid-binding protein
MKAAELNAKAIRGDVFWGRMPAPYREGPGASGHAAAPARCLYCASIVLAGDAPRACPCCGQDYVATHDKRVGAPCPRCPRETLAPTALDDATVYVCQRCHGCFVHALDWDELLAAADAGERGSLGSLVPPPPGQGPTPRELFASVPCPVCASATQRFEFAGHRGLWVDACPRHGLWLDAGELVAVVQQHEAHPDAIEAPMKRVATEAVDEPGAAAREAEVDLTLAYAAVAPSDPHAAARYASEVATDAVRCLLAIAGGVVEAFQTRRY